MSSPIKTLERIQKIDLEIIAVEEERRGYGENSERVARELDAAREEAERLEAEAEEIERHLGGIEERQRDNAEKTRRADQRMREVRNEKELKALSKEKIEAGKAKRALDAEQAELAASLEKLRTELEAKKAEAAEKADALAAIKGELEGKSSGWEELLDEKRSARDTLALDLDPDLFGKYKAIRDRRGGRAVVPVRKEACQGCFMHIPPQTYIQLKRGDEELITCPHCHRILYVEDEATPEAV